MSRLVTPTTVLAVALFASFVGLIGWLTLALMVLAAVMHIPKPTGSGSETPPSMWVVFAIMNVAAVWLFTYRRKLIRRSVGEPKSYGFPVAGPARSDDLLQFSKDIASKR